ncbi:MAG: hypothetical protein ACR2J4_02680 [Deinococcus sp.]
MIQTVYVLELLRPGGPVRARFAQSEGRRAGLPGATGWAGAGRAWSHPWTG